LVKMQLDRTRAELTEHLLNALSDGGVVGAVASDKFFDNRAYCSGCQQSVGNKHRQTSSGGATPEVIVTKIDTIGPEVPRGSIAMPRKRLLGSFRLLFSLC
jgi:hypothetical protein